MVPPVGGDTLFADLEAAYNGLSPQLQALVDGLTVYHDGENFQDWAWGPNVSDEERRASSRSRPGRSSIRSCT